MESCRVRASCRLILAATLIFAAVGPAPAEVISGPVSAEVIRVIDGDTLALRAHIWLGQDITVNARIRGIDAPEMHGKCEREKHMAEAARLRLVAAAGNGKLRLTRIENDKYAGRVLADVITDAGTNLGAAMLESGSSAPMTAAGATRGAGWRASAGSRGGGRAPLDPRGQVPIFGLGDTGCPPSGGLR